MNEEFDLNKWKRNHWKRMIDFSMLFQLVWFSISSILVIVGLVMIWLNFGNQQLALTYFVVLFIGVMMQFGFMFKKG